jgi:hypothetical protein
MVAAAIPCGQWSVFPAISSQKANPAHKSLLGTMLLRRKSSLETQHGARTS